LAKIAIQIREWSRVDELKQISSINRRRIVFFKGMEEEFVKRTTDGLRRGEGV
jgi:hypothetical protein